MCTNHWKETTRWHNTDITHTLLVCKHTQTYTSYPTHNTNIQSNNKHTQKWHTHIVVAVNTMLMQHSESKLPEANQRLSTRVMPREL